MPVGHRRRRNGVVGAIHRRGDVREVREGGIHKGVHKVIARPRLPQPRLFLPSNGNSSGNSGPPSAASLSRLAHITTLNDRTNDHLNLEPADVQDPFHISRSSQPSAALVGGARTRA